jgi:hypothetical protein
LTSSLLLTVSNAETVSAGSEAEDAGRGQLVRANLKDYLGRIAFAAKRTIVQAPASAQIRIYKSGIVLSARVLWNGRPFHCTPHFKYPAKLQRLCEVEKQAWMGTPYPGYPTDLGCSSLFRVNLSPRANEFRIISTAELVEVYDQPQSFQYDDRVHVSKIAQFIRAGDTREISDLLFENDYPDNAPFLAAKNLWMNIAGVANGSYSRRLDLQTLIDAFPPDWVDAESVKARIRPIQVRINDNLLTDLHASRTPQLESIQYCSELRESLADLFEIIIGELLKNHQERDK